MSFLVRTPWMAALVFLSMSTFALRAQEPSQAPEGIPPESDYMYRKHYDEVQQIMQSPLAGREAKLEGYMKKLDPKSKILQTMAGFFGQILSDYQKAGQSQQAGALMDKIGRLFPEAAAAMEGQAFQQAFQSKDYPKAIQLGEKLYAKNQNQQIAAMLAESYIASQNNAKALEFSNKLLQSLGTQKGVYYAAWIAGHYRGQGDVANAVRYYDQIVKAFPSGAPTGWTSQGWTELKVNAHGVLGSDAYSKQDFDGAVRHFEEALQFAPKNDGAYLILGLSQWKLQKLDEAIDAFAKCTVLNKPSSGKARGYLEQLFKARNNDSTEGMDGLLDAARQALGV